MTTIENQRLSPQSSHSFTQRATRSIGLLSVAILGAGQLIGCKEEQIQVYDIPKTSTNLPTNAPANAPADAPAATPAAVPAAIPVATPPAVPVVAPAAPSATQPAGPVGGQPIQIGEFKAVVPGGWVQDPKPRMMREATFVVGPAEKKTEVIITKLNGPSGDLLGNVVRWRAQVGLPPVATVNEADYPTVKLPSGEARRFDFAGPDEKAPQRRLIQIVSPRPDGSTYFVKIIGDAGLVGEQRPAFDKFLESIEFAK